MLLKIKKLTSLSNIADPRKHGYYRNLKEQKNLIDLVKKTNFVSFYRKLKNSPLFQTLQVHRNVGIIVI